MTCIAALVHDGKIWMAGDSAGVGSSDIEIRKDPKVFQKGPFLIGFTSSFRMGQILQYNLVTTAQPFKKMDDFQYMVSVFVEDVRKCFSKHGFNTSTNGQDAGGSFLVGYRGKIYKIESDYQVGESVDPFNSVGCGSQEALASLYSTQLTDWPPETRLQIALEAAAYYNTGVRAPFNMLVL